MYSHTNITLDSTISRLLRRLRIKSSKCNHNDDASKDSDLRIDNDIAVVDSAGAAVDDNNFVVSQLTSVLHIESLDVYIVSVW